MSRTLQFDTIVEQINAGVKQMIQPHKIEPIVASNELLHELNALHRRFAEEMSGQDDEKALEFAIRSIVSSKAAERLAEIRELQLFSTELKILEAPTIETKSCESVGRVVMQPHATSMYQRYMSALHTS